MDEGVEESEEGGVSAGHESGAGPYRHRHDAVVNDMQQRHMGELLPSYKRKLRGGREIEDDELIFFSILTVSRNSVNLLK